jgi:SH3 domain-containing YSC84-like protein 1
MRPSSEEKEITVIQHENRNQFRDIKRAGSLLVATLCLLIPLAGKAADDDADIQRIKDADNVLKDLINGPPGIPQDILNKAECVVVLPAVKKGGFIVGGQYGRGLMTCRSGENFSGNWSAPIMMQSHGGSFGLQAGGQAVDFVVMVMNDKGARAVIKGKAKLGGDASVAAGPVGRDAEASTTATMEAEMLSYSRSKGAFAGVSLSGTSLGPDDDANEKVYGKKISGEEIFAGSVQAPPQAAGLLSTLQQKSPSNASRGKS